ncbi:hypothetical protein [Candidatus Uabimicrobium amorphum]|uniref:Uncharacterized protein n=1 Tax=Uabimicrobium amorphum TaxID=2596890 RepID=A0A5S9IL02_UABAM|nr:hypothetical protein [Candidatus Uabimicrobium amorphum]BBM82525.1 hypothetical protein UABAM_00868 [Candidatus Uabimicrobium amorphum]
MAKKKKSMLKKLVLFTFVAFFVGTMYFLHHFGIIAFSGNGQLGWGTNAIQPTTNELSFYFCDDKIYQGKNEINEDRFRETITAAKEKDRSIDLFFVQEKITNKFHVGIKKIVDKADVVFSEKKISADQLPK